MSFTSRLLIFALATSLAALAGDPQLESWQTANTRRYARIYESDAARLAGTTVTTWSRGTTAQSTPSYAGVIQVSSSANWVYLRSSGLGTHVMGPWYLNAAHTQNFPSFPANTGVLYRIPRTPTIPATKTLTGLAAIGYFVDGVAAFDNRDAFSYVTASGNDASPVNGLRGDGVWNREAYANEGVTFDPAFAHQAMTNHHYHANAPAVRYQLGDHVDFNSTTKLYTESTAPVTAHSPIVAWLADGLPVYGPYGYASPMDAKSGLRRMTSGYVKRDGTNGTTISRGDGSHDAPGVGGARAKPQRDAADQRLRPGGECRLRARALYRGLRLPRRSRENAGHRFRSQRVQRALLRDAGISQRHVGLLPHDRGGRHAEISEYGRPVVLRQPHGWRRQRDQRNGHGVCPRQPGLADCGDGDELRRHGRDHVDLGRRRDLPNRIVGRCDHVDGAPECQCCHQRRRRHDEFFHDDGGDELSRDADRARDLRHPRGRRALGCGQRRHGDGGGGLLGHGAPRQYRDARRARRNAAGTPIPGFVLSGAGTKPMLIRAVGPTLATFGLTGVLADPRLSLIGGSATLATNDNWLAGDAATMAGAGAFALPAASKDAALVATLAAGSYSAPVAATDNGSGVALLEVYDAATTSAVNVINASTRAFVGTGDAVLIPGFVISGTGALKLLIRAVGPTLANLGVSGVLADPTVTLYRGNTALATNDNWSAADAPTMAAVGAFALTAGSRDAALVTTLPAGAYSAIVSGVGNTTGTALVELYAVP
jgi:hypothetical protein